MNLDHASLLEVIERTPLVSIDLVVVDPDHRVLCGWRVNQPARETWFVPGGRIRKDEKLDDAFNRIARAELGDGEWDRPDARFLGVFEHHHDANFAEAPDITTHYVVLVYRIDVTDRPSPPDEQHSRYAWFSKADLENEPARSSVHPYTAAYFEYI